MRRKKKALRKYCPLFIMMLPGLVYLLFNNYLPLFGLIIPFKKINYSEGILLGILKGDWVGFENFRFLFQSSTALEITRNTILYNLAFIIVNTAAAIFIAVLFREVSKKVFLSFFQSALLFPNFISMVIVSYVVFGFLSAESGFLNQSVLPLLGLTPQNWYSTAAHWPAILILVNLWKNVGMLSIIYMASMISINPQIYEAAQLDGAGKLKQVRYITLPMIVPVIIMMVLLAVGRIFYSDFGLFYQVPMNSGALYDVTSTIDTYVFRSLIHLGDIGMASAAGLYQSFVGLVLVIASNLIIRKVDRDSALF